MNSQYVLPTYARAPMTMAKGEGSYLFDTEGRRYVDFCAGIATCCLGHCNPIVVDALCQQAHRLMHCSNLYTIGEQERLAKLIVEKVIGIPGRIFFCNSGAEANDGIIKVARRFGHRRRAADGSPRYEVITFRKGFHGRTLGSMAATGQEKIQIEFDPMLVGFRYVDFNNIEELRAAIRPETCGIMLEAIQGEGGVNPVRPEFLRAIADLCKEHDLLLMIDEVQCGFYRCGTPMGWKAICPDIRPDLVSCAKGIGGGFPMGCFWVSNRAINDEGTELSSIMGPGSHGSTFGGTPLACATSYAVVSELVSGNYGERVTRMGELIKSTVEGWNLPVVECVRGLGLLRGVALRRGSFTVPEGSTPAAYVNSLCMQAGLLCCPAGADTLRLIPALNIPEDVLREGLDILHGVLSKLA
ncbi:MAG TPA: acetylornithine transaminase [Candidatus Akkermansia intestinavium]|nr:acetylornithine transaminase [Candidatus Akkermansia intestinavium]